MPGRVFETRPIVSIENDAVIRLSDAFLVWRYLNNATRFPRQHELDYDMADLDHTKESPC